MTQKSSPRRSRSVKVNLTRREFLVRTAGFGASVGAAALLAACGQSAAPATEEVPATATPTLPPAPTVAVAENTPTPEPEAMVETEPEEEVMEEETMGGGTITYMGHHEVAGLSPDDAGPTVHWVMITNIHNALLELDENVVLQPTLAESFEVADDGLQYTFHLREGVLFHDGKELTSADVQYTWDFYRDPDNAAVIANNFQGIDNIETPDDYTVVINMETPNAAFLTTAATTFIVQSEYHADVGQEVYRSEPIGTGAFKVVEYNPAEYTLLEAFDDHFRGRPKIDFLREDIVPEASTRAIALSTGDGDTAVWPLLVEDNLRFEEDPNFVVFRSATRAVNHFPINNQLPQLSDKRVRQALLHAIDRQQVIDDIFSGAAVIADTNLSPSLAQWHNPDTPKYEYNVDRAAELFDEAGWVMGDDGVREKDGEKLTFTITVISGDQARRPEAELVQKFWADVGVEMQIAEAPISVILEGLRVGETDGSLFNWTYGSIDPDASTTLRSDGGNNFSHFENERVDELLDTGLVTIDSTERQTIYNEIQEIVADEVPFIYMMYWDWFNIYNARIKGLPEGQVLDGGTLYRKAHEWWIEES